MSDLRGKRLFITGASRGIGRAIALAAARQGASVAIVAKTAEPHPKLPGTIHTVAEEVDAAGGRGLAVQADIRYEEQVHVAMETVVAELGGLDALVNNASAIWLAPTTETPMKRFDLMWGVNARGTYLCSRTAIPHLRRGDNPHILNLSPPLDLDPRWFRNHTAYTISKYGMSMCAMGMAAELAGDGIAVNALWPRTVIRTAALAMLPPGYVEPEACREPEIVADAAVAILARPSRECTGNFFIDDEVLAEEGVTDFDRYAVDPSQELLIDLFLDPSSD
ncbi:MAG: NAD(P)-dependent oxidoreductase [Thermoanaerobaculia bacterium]|nr:NAD(P)-dependent oxidoreductase [Thermoanaerobaculia bacterium]